MTSIGPKSAAAPRFRGTENANAGVQALEAYSTAGKPGFWLFLFFIVQMYLQLSYRVPSLGAIRFEFILGALLSVFAIYEASRIQWTPAPKLRTFVALLFLCMLIQVPLSVAPAYSWGIFVDRVYKFALMGFFIAAFVRSPNALRWFLAAFLFACIRMSFEGLLGSITGSMIWENQGVPRLHGATPSYSHPNSFAGMALGTLPFIMYLAPLSSMTIRLILLAQGALALNVVLRTGSRTGYVAFALLLAVAAMRAKKKFRTFALGAIFIGLAIPFIPEDYVGRATSIFTQKDKEGESTELRREILRDAWAIFKEHPLGIGVGAFPVVRMYKFGRAQDTHNLYFEVGTNLGVLGLAVFIAMIGAMLGTLNRMRREFAKQAAQLGIVPKPDTANARDGPVWQHQKDLRFLEGTCSAVFMFTVVRLALGLFGHDLYEVYWWFALGLTFALLNILTVATRRTAAMMSLAEADGA
jgi:putative inorganic carbon (HCO3(-)) transporter